MVSSVCIDPYFSLLLTMISPLLLTILVAVLPVPAAIHLLRVISRVGIQLLPMKTRLVMTLLVFERLHQGRRLLRPQALITSAAIRLQHLCIVFKLGTILRMRTLSLTCQLLCRHCIFAKVF